MFLAGIRWDSAHKLILMWSFLTNDLTCPAEQAKAVTGFISAITESQSVMWLWSFDKLWHRCVYQPFWTCPVVFSRDIRKAVYAKKDALLRNLGWGRPGGEGVKSKCNSKPCNYTRNMYWNPFPFYFLQTKENCANAFHILFLRATTVLHWSGAVSVKLLGVLLLWWFVWFLFFFFFFSIYGEMMLCFFEIVSSTQHPAVLVKFCPVMSKVKYVSS